MKSIFGKFAFIFIILLLIASITVIPACTHIDSTRIPDHEEGITLAEPDKHENNHEENESNNEPQEMLEPDAPDEPDELDEPQVLFRILSPYENINWETIGQYRASHHVHTTFSDGSNTLRDMLIDLYNKNYDIVAIADHNTTTRAWNTHPDIVYEISLVNENALLSSEELADINNGAYNASDFPGSYTGRRTQANGMISMGISNEITAGMGYQPGIYEGHHINSFFANVPNYSGFGMTMAEVIEYVQDLGGITHLNHPGRYTGMQSYESLTPELILTIDRYVQLFLDYPSLAGIEIMSRWDSESINDRIFWDYILMETMPQERPVWGFSNDDAHSLSANGHAWNVMLMATFDKNAFRTSMETGAFYGVSRIDRQRGVNAFLPDGEKTPYAPSQTSSNSQYTGGRHNSIALQFLSEETPVISSIEIIGDTITISGTGFNKIVWIADRKIVHTGDSIDISKIYGINSYVRAELIGSFGVAYTQPFGIEKRG